MSEETLNESHLIRMEAESLLGRETLDELTNWYKWTLEEDWDFVAFVVRRSYILGLIMEKITNKRMEESSVHTVFLTDAALLLRSDEMASAYRETGRFPKILLIDDLLIHGRNLNQLIECIEKSLCEKLPEYDEEQVKDALVAAMRIRVFARCSTQLLLDSRYTANMKFQRNDDIATWHLLSGELSSLILRTNIVNTSYIYSECIGEQDFVRVKEELDRDHFILTQYQNVQQWAKVHYIGFGRQKKAILTIRIVKNTGVSSYTIVPYIFLPDLEENELQNFSQALCNKMKDKGIYDEDYMEWIDRLEKGPGKRSYSEFLIMILSNVLLLDFNEKYNIIEDNDDRNKRDEEIRRLVRNYNCDDIEKTEKLLWNLLKEKLWNIEELETMFREYISDEKFVLDLYSDDDRSVLSEEKIADIIKQEENHFYRMGLEEEKDACKMLEWSFFSVRKKEKRKVRDCKSALVELNRRYDRTEANYSIAYLLQMADAGILSLPLYVPDEKEEVGFSQCVKTGEQSLFLKPLRIYEYIPMLDAMQYECDCSSVNKELKDEVWEYSRNNPQELPSEDVEEIVDCVTDWKEIGQRPSDWLGNYLIKIDFSKTLGKEFQQAVALMDQRKRHKEQYVSYAKEK